MPWPWILVGILVGAAILRAIPLLTGVAFQAGNLYDDGVYFAAASLLPSGALPYADYVFLHPPGVVLAFAPVALLGDALGLGPREQLALARVVVAAIGVVNVLLVAWVAREWKGWPAAVIAASIVATTPIVLQTESTLFLEPLLNLACLAAIALWVRGEHRPTRHRREIVAIAVLLAAAVLVKLWAAVLIAGIAAVLVKRRAWRDAAVMVVAGGVTVLVVTLPFLLRDPVALVSNVVGGQLGRPPEGLADRGERLTQLFDIGPIGLGGLHTIALGVVIIGGALILGWAVLRGGSVGRFFAVVVSLTAAIFLVSPVFYRHYPAFIVPGVAVLVAGAVVSLAGAAQRRGSWVRAAVIATVAVVVAVGTVRGVRTQLGLANDSGAIGPAIAAAVPAGECVVADDPTWLLIASRLPPVSGDPGATVDLYGARLIAAGASGEGPFASTADALRSEAAQAVLASHLATCPYAVVMPADVRWTPATEAAFRATHRVVADWSAEGGPILFGPASTSLR